MIIISAGAGLGNQMFEYAFYMKVKKVYKDVIVKLDPNYAFPKAHNGYEVERIFGLTSEKATYDEVAKLADKNYLENNKRYSSVYSRVKRKAGLHKNSFVAQKDFTEYYEKFFRLDASKSYYLYGPFANYRYFNDIKEEVCDAFQFPAINDEMKEIAEQIRGTDSVSIHVRRGDYVDLGIELLDESFYNTAIKRLAEILKTDKQDLTFFIFSDDVEAAELLFKDLNNKYIVEGNDGDNSYRDMQLMSMCKHNIISNSTFSFWGAYLNSNSNKVVIGSKTPLPRFKRSFTCDGWIMI